NCICGELRAAGRVVSSLRRRANEHYGPAHQAATALARGRDRAAAPRHDLLRRVRCAGRMPPAMRTASGLGVCLNPACALALLLGTVQKHCLKLYWHGPRREPTCVKDKGMRLKQLCGSGLVVVILGGLVGVTTVAAAGEQWLPVLGTREGAGRVQGIPLGNGYSDYLTLLNERDGGINGVTVVGEECETVYDVQRGIACYERLKA